MSLTANENALIRACGGHVDEILPADWPAVAALALRHDVAALVAWECAQRSRAPFGPTFVPESVVQQALEASEIAQVFASLFHIPALLFKGASVHHRWFPTGARRDDDIDIHIPRSDYERARNTLFELGYAIRSGEDERVQLDQTKDVGFVRHDQNGILWSVELHVRLAEPGAPDISSRRLLASAKVLALDGQPVPVPSTEYTLLLLALNLRKHRFARFKTIVDISRIIELSDQQIDWEFLGNEAKRFGYLGLLRQALGVTAEIMGDNGQVGAALCTMPPTHFWWPSHHLSRIATTTTVFGEARAENPAKRLSGLIPFAALDKPLSSVHLVSRRLSLRPETASYYRSQGDPGAPAYRSRLGYWRDISRRLWRAAGALR